MMNPYLKNLSAVALILAAAVCVYFNTVEYPFAFDDQRTVLENVKIRDLDTFYSIDVFRAPRPLVDFTFALNYHFGRLHVFGYHVVNLLFHLLNGILVFFLSRRIFQKLCALNATSIYFMALFCALLFVVHPLQTQAVTYISQRYTSMAAWFYMMSVLCYMIARDAGVDRDRFRQSYTMYALTAVLGLLAFFCKQNAASLPMAIVLIEYGCYDQTWAGWKRKIKFIIPFIILFSLAFVYNLGLFSRDVQFGSFLEDVFEAARETREITRWQYLCTQFNVISVYIRLLFLPIDQNLDYLYPMKDGFFDGATAYLFVFLVGILSASIWYRKKHPVVFIGVLWFFITLSVESSIFPIKDALFEHRLYLPAFGYALILSYGILVGFSAYRFCSYGISLTIVLTLGLATYHRNEIWKTSVSLWSDVVKKNPSNYRGITNLAHAMELDGKTEAALSLYDRAIHLKSDYQLALSNKGALLGKIGKYEESIVLFQKVLNVTPHYPFALNNMGVSLAAQEKYKDAEYYFLKAIEFRPGYIDALNNLMITYKQKHDYVNALQVCLMIIRIDPNNHVIYTNAGDMLYTLQRYPEAVEQYNSAIKLDPSSSEVYYKKGNALLAADKPGEAVDAYKIAADKSPEMVECWVNTGVAYMKIKNNEEAVSAFEKALKIDINQVEAHANLGVLFYLQGNTIKSLEHFSVARRLKPDSEEIKRNYNKILGQRIKMADQ